MSGNTENGIATAAAELGTRDGRDFAARLQEALRDVSGDVIPSNIAALVLARWVAKTIYAADLVERCMVTVSGTSEAFAIDVNTYGTEKHGKTKACIEAAVQELFPTDVVEVTTELGLTMGILRTQDTHVPWEQVPKAHALRRRFGLRNREGAPQSWPGSNLPGPVAVGIS